MVGSRLAFLERLSSFRLATQADIIVSKAPTEQEHNGRARLMRNGLAVVGYAIVEDFIKSRTGEVLQRIGTGATPFQELPQGIRLAATAGVVDAIKHQEKFLERGSTGFYSFYQSHARSIASTSQSAYEISTLAFMQNQSNIATNSSLDYER